MNFLNRIFIVLSVHWILMVGTNSGPVDTRYNLIGHQAAEGEISLPGFIKQDTSEPKSSNEPNNTDEPNATNEPNTSGEPNSTGGPQTSDTPAPSNESNSTNEPNTNGEPNSTNEPNTSSEPNTTAELQTSDKPASTDESISTGESNSTAEPQTSDTPAPALLGFTSEIANLLQLEKKPSFRNIENDENITDFSISFVGSLQTELNASDSNYTLSQSSPYSLTVKLFWENKPAGDYIKDVLTFSKNYTQQNTPSGYSIQVNKDENIRIKESSIYADNTDECEFNVGGDKQCTSDSQTATEQSTIDQTTPTGTASPVQFKPQLAVLLACSLTYFVVKF